VEPITRLAHAERAMLRVPSHAVADVTRDLLISQYGAKSVDLLLIDYRMSVLQPVLGDGPAQPVGGSPAGEAFIHQRPVSSGDEVYVPMSVQGADRSGVLALRLPEPPDEVLLAELAEVAGVAAQAIVVADQATDRFRGARRTERLTLAAEMQWQLLPGRSLSRPEFDLGGQLEPAYAVRGDTFDWSADGHHLTLIVANGMGDGVHASLLTSLVIGALRNARRAELGLADQAALADQAVYGQYHGQSHVSTLLLRFDLATGRVRVVDAGSPRLYRLRGGTTQLMPLEAQLPLGMFDGTVYTEQEFAMVPGDRLFVLSDGIHEAQIDGGVYGETLLESMLATTRALPPTEAVRVALADLTRLSPGPDGLADDAVAVCVDWRGRP
jgi:serine phosphatase RsbU (regulator of sigma subunit)